MNWLGNFSEDFASVVCMFTTHQANGAPVAPSTAFEAADVLIYKNGSNTQKTSTNGVTMTSPFDSITGLHCLVIDTSNDTGDVGFWVAGALYTLVLSPDETVDGIAVAKVIGQFGLDLANNVSSIAAIKAKTDQLAFGTANRVNAQVYGMEADTLTAAAIATDAIGSAELAASAATEIADAVWATTARLLTAGTNIVLAKGTGITGLNDLSAAQVNAEADTALADVGLTGTVTGRIDVAVSSRLATSGYTAPLDAAGVRSAVGLASADLDTQLAAKALQASVDDLPTNAELAIALGTADDAVLAQVALVRVKTDNLPSDPADASDIAAAFSSVAGGIAAVQADTDNIQTRLPAALVGGRMDSNMQAAAAGVIDATVAPNLDAAVSTRLATSGYTAPDNAGIAAILDDTGSSGVVVAASSKTGYELSPAGVAAVWAQVVEGAITALQMMRGFAAALLGKASGLGTATAVYRDIGDTKDRITATVDADGNRPAVVRDLT